MNCRNCGQSNPQTAHFCMRCGQAQALVCHGCGGALPPEATFCVHCGRRVPSSDSRADSAPQGALGPEGATEESDNGADVGGERRQVTVVFSDLAGYTALNESVDPEEVEGFMNRIKSGSVEIVERHGGIVNQFVGDEVLALFGIPTAHEDDARRAVAAALELHAFVDTIGAEVRERTGHALRMHSGINTGLVVFRHRDSRSGSYAITGDAVNTAARLVGLATGGEVLLSPETHRMVEPFYETVALPTVEMKGKSHPVAPYRVLGRSDIDSRFEAAIQVGLSPFTGRDQELERMQAALEAVLDSQGRLITVTGEAGQGKSRLLHEFSKRLAEHPVTVLATTCQSYGAETPYLPFIAALRQDWGLATDDEPERLRAKIGERVAQQKALADYLPFYLHLLSLPSPEQPLPPNLAGQELALAFGQALAAWLLVSAASRARVLVMEDWHWADAASRAVLRTLIGRLKGAALMLVISHRPELEERWGPDERHCHVALQPMTASQSRQMMQGVLGVAHLPEGLAELIHERTGGNPFFMEEMVSTLAEDGTLTVLGDTALLAGHLDALVLPGTVQMVIRSRLDRLDRYARETLGLASVVGREFARQVLDRIATERERLGSSIDTLKAGELIQQVRVVPDAAYTFKNVLTQEVTYETLLRERRRQLHAAVAKAIEELNAERLDEQVEVLLHHYTLAEVWEKAAHYARRSAEKAHAMSQFLQAAHFYQQSVDCLRRLPADLGRARMRVDMQLEACFCYINLGSFDEAVALGEASEADVAALNDSHRLVRLQVMFGTAWMYKGSRERCEYYLLPAVEVMERGEDALSLANCRHVLAGCYVGQGLWNLAVPQLDEAITIYEREGVWEEYLYGYYVLPYVVGCAQLGYAWAVQGNVRESTELLRKGLQRSLAATANFATRGIFISWMSLHTLLLGEDRLGIQTRADEMVRKAEASDSPFLLLGGRVLQTNLLMAEGNTAKVRDLCAQAITALAGSNIRTGHVANLFYNAILAEIVEGDTAAAAHHLLEARPLEAVSPHWYGPRFDMLEAMLADRAGMAEESERLFERSIAGDEAAGAAVLAAQTRYRQARARARRGDSKVARSMLKEQARLFGAWGIPVWQRLCTAALGKLG